jgi:hypothetical protein
MASTGWFRLAFALEQLYHLGHGLFAADQRAKRPLLARQTGLHLGCQRLLGQPSALATSAEQVAEIGRAFLLISQPRTSLWAEPS